MTRLIHIFSAWLNVAWNFMKCHPRLTLLFLVVLTLLTAYIMGYLFLFLFLFLLLILVMLVSFTMCVARLTRKAAKDRRDASAKVGRLWLEFALVVAFGLVVVAIQSVLQEEIAVRSDYFNAISQLGSLSPVVRISGIDYLIETCMGEKKELHPDKCNKDDTIELLSNQVKFFTQSKSYREDFEEYPSGDIAKIIEILKEMQGLSNIVWEGAYLRGANLDEANLQGANLSSANLQGADLYMTNLQDAKLYKADLQGADLQGANLQGANLYGANLQKANLWEANLQGAHLWGANLQGAGLNKAKLQGADLWGTNLREANLQGAELQGADLSRANLQEALLHKAHLQGAYLQGANLQGAYLQGANLQGANLYGANLQEVLLHKAHLQGAYSKYEHPPVNFCTRINSRVDKRAEIEEANVLFSGGITEELWEEMNKTQWHNEEVKKRFLRKMESHLNINKDPIYTIPDEVKNTVNTCTLTKETATAIIKEYNESLTGERPRCELPQ